MKDKKPHVYVNENGIEVPSVTTIIKIIDKPEIPKWANALGLRNVKYDTYMEERSEIGTDFHKMVEDYMSGKEVKGTHYKESIKMFKRFMVWADNHYYKVFRHEVSLVCDSYGGTFDAIGEVDGVVTLIDYKTSKVIYPQFFIQLAGYATLLKKLEPETYDKIKAFGVVTMRKEESYKAINKKIMESVFIPAFNEALALYMSWDKISKGYY
jgi:hypothetical protein